MRARALGFESENHYEPSACIKTFMEIEIASITLRDQLFRIDHKIRQSAVSKRKSNCKFSVMDLSL